MAGEDGEASRVFQSEGVSAWVSGAKSEENAEVLFEIAETRRGGSAEGDEDAEAASEGTDGAGMAWRPAM